MNCRSYQKLMEEYLEGSLSENMKADFDLHMKDCAACRELLALDKHISGSLTDLMGRTTGVLALRPEVQANIMSAIVEADIFKPYEEMLKLFENLTFREKWARIFHGLRQPRETGPHKWARLQIMRLWSPAMGVAVPVLVVLLAILIGSLTPDKAPAIEVRIQELETKEDLKEMEKLPEPEVIPVPEKILDPTDAFAASTSLSAPGPDVDFSPQPAAFDSVAIIRSPVVMKGVFGSRSPGARGSALGKFGGGPATEGAVLRALRWLKKNQEPDGSWIKTSGGGKVRAGDVNTYDVGMTGLALLAYLAHGETPASPEFGVTVDKAIKHLMNRQGADGSYPQRWYEHPIAAYALSEAYSMTKLPAVQEKARKAIDFMVAGQNASGGFDYGLNRSARDDVSVTGWCVQAMKAARMAGFDSSGLDNAMNKSIDAVKRLYEGDSKAGWFTYTYTERNKTHLSGVGVLSLQLLGQPKCQEARGGLAEIVVMDPFSWPATSWSQIYYWYYNTQAKFHEGGDVWKNWNKQFSVSLSRAQVVTPKAIEGPGRQLFDIGYWDANNDVAGRVMDTTLCTLMLEVYYRYLPTFQKPEELAADARANADQIVEAKDLDVQVNLDGVPLQ